MRALKVFSIALLTTIMTLVDVFALNTEPVNITIYPVAYFDQKALFAIKLDIASGWKVYANKAAGTGLPLKIEILEHSNIASYKISWPAFKTLTESIGKETLESHIYENQVLIPISITPINNDKSIKPTVKVTFGACNKICIKKEKVLISEMEPDYFDSKIYEHIVSIGDYEESHQSILLMLLFAIIGGLILNFMPCVLPVLSLKLLALLKHYSKESHIFRANLLATVFGITASFLSLAVVTICLKHSGEQVGWGFHFQSSTFLMFMVVILVIFASNLWGDFNIRLPTWLNNALYKSGNYEGTYGSFITGIVATFLATPCTAPFLTTAIAFALPQSNITITYIYLAIALGMSLPYLLLLLSKKSMSILPKPGPWMIKLKKASAVLFLLTAVWLIYVLFYQLSFRAILVFVCSIVLLKFLITFLNKKFGIWRLLILLIALILAFVLPLSLNESIEEEQATEEAFWETFDEEQLSKYIASNQTVLLDITAEWCLVCKTNKLLTLERDDVLAYVLNNNIILMRGNYTNRNESITKFLESNQRHSIPFNAVYGPNAKKGIILPELLSKEAIIKAVKKAKGK